MMRALRLVVVVTALASCARAPSSPAADAGASVCANLAKLGCAEGTADDCATALNAAIASNITSVNPACLAVATTKDGARACGPFVSCP